MSTYTCIDCGKTGQGGRSDRKRCDDCQKIDQRERLRRSRARRRVAPTFTCVDCGTTGEGRADRKRCDACRTEHERTYHRGYYRANLSAPERTWTCVDCGATGTGRGTGNPRIRCDACIRKVKAERMRAAELPPTECADCGVLVPRSLGRDGGGASRRPFKRCPECAQKFKIGRRTARVNAPGREYFEHREIFDRDGWLCYLCGEAVSSFLAYPDPGSASLDHVIPLAAGGKHTRANTACTHLGCNVRKHAKIIETMEA